MAILKKFLCPEHVLLSVVLGTQMILVWPNGKNENNQL